MEHRLITAEEERELAQLFNSLDDIQIITETTNVLTADEYDELTNFKWESYENEEQIGLFEG
jgi:hypothetical protein